MMYKVMIVDDERLIREGLQCLLDWESLGFRVVDLSQDAQDAREKFARHLPDVVLMDIKMPGTDGLSLIRELKQVNPETRFIILSGYTDFEYTKQAITLKIDAYLRKTVDEDELAESLVNIRDILDDKAARRLQAAGEAASSGSPGQDPGLQWSRMAASYLKAALTMKPGNEVHDRSCTYLEKNLAWPAWQVFLIEARCQLDGGWQRVLAALELEFAARKAGIALECDSWIGLVLPQEHVNQKHLVQLYRHVDSILRPLSLEFFVACGKPVESAGDLHESYEQARERMKYRFYAQPGSIITALPDLDFRRSAPAETREDFAGQVERLYLALHSGNEDLVMQIIDGVINPLVGSDDGENQIKSQTVRLLSGTMNRLVSANAAAWGNGGENFDWISGCYLRNSLIELRAWIHENLILVMEQDSGDGAQGLVRKITELVRKNYYKNLKLESLSEVFSYNSAYLGKLFKLHTGDSFHTFLDKVRIEKAKELLGQGMKVYLVAERVGYAYVDYFHGKFRKYTGMSPSEYRKSLGREDVELADD